MMIRDLVFKELLHRKLNVFLSLISVALATGCVVGAAGFMRVFNISTERVLADKEREAKKLSDSLQEAYRKIGVNMGFNILILPADQDLSDMLANDYASKCMPEWYADTLAHAGIITIQHLLPMLQQKLTWPEKRRTIILVGVRGEVPLLHGEAKKPIMETVPPGKIILGHELWTNLHLTPGSGVTLSGRRFSVARCYDERGTKDDITAWINLGEAQEISGKKGLINGIMALECNCAMANVALVRHEIDSILPKTQIVELSSKALARAESRAKAAAFAQQTVDNEEQNRFRLRAEKERFFSVLLTIIMLVCALWVCLLAFANVRERRVEIGVFRALGYRSVTIISLFLTRAFFIGLAGAIIGIFGGLIAGMTHSIHALGNGGANSFVDPVALLCSLLGAPLLSVLACWLPAIAAVNQDPATALRGE